MSRVRSLISIGSHNLLGPILYFNYVLALGKRQNTKSIHDAGPLCIHIIHIIDSADRTGIMNLNQIRINVLKMFLECSIKSC